jgi:hypothetical protein
MKIYKNRHDDVFLSRLNECLTIDGENGILKSAIKIKSPRVFEGKEYTHCCRIDFLGVSATALLDFGGNYCDNNVSDAFEKLFTNVEEINKENAFVKIRFLFVYPYSVVANGFMQAEITRNRAVINSSIYNRDFNFIEQVDEDLFKSSTFYTTQFRALEDLQVLIDKYGWDDETLNMIEIRFVPMSPELCTYIINDKIFYEPYLLAKEKEASNRLAKVAPVLEVCQERFPEFYAGVEDHFRYLWLLDTTIYAKDGTRYCKNSPRTLSKIKPPSGISFDYKKKHLKKFHLGKSDIELKSWNFQVKHLLKRQCFDPSISPSNETLFITCSWEPDVDNRFKPNNKANKLASWLDEDFGSGLSEQLISVFIMEARAARSLSRQLYARFEEATLAIVVLTKDIEAKDGKFYSRANVYHELGYFMKKLDLSRILILAEKDVVIPSNIHDIVRIEFSSEKQILCYDEILNNWLFQATDNIDKSAKEIAFNKFINRLQESVTKGIIKPDEFEVQRTKAEDFKKTWL